jgi:hypothetical protein
MAKQPKSELTLSLTATGSVRGAFFSLGTTPSSDSQLGCAQVIYEEYVLQRILKNETLLGPVHAVRLE